MPLALASELTSGTNCTNSLQGVTLRSLQVWHYMGDILRHRHQAGIILRRASLISASLVIPSSATLEIALAASWGL